MIRKEHYKGYNIYWHGNSGYSVNDGWDRYKSIKECKVAIDAHLELQKKLDRDLMTEEDKYWESLTHEQRQYYRKTASNCNWEDSAIALAYKMRNQ